MKQLTYQEMMLAAQQVEHDRAVVKEIYARWPNVRVKYLDPDHVAAPNDRPFMVVEVDERGGEHIIFTCDAIDERVIEQLKRNDQHHVDLEEVFRRETEKIQKAEEYKEEQESGAVQDLLEVGIRHFNRGKLKYRWTDEYGDKKVAG